MENILYIPQRKREPDVEHHRQANDFGRGYEVTEWAVFLMPGGYFAALPVSTRFPLTSPTHGILTPDEAYEKTTNEIGSLNETMIHLNLAANWSYI